MKVQLTKWHSGFRPPQGCSYSGSCPGVQAAMRPSRSQTDGATWTRTLSLPNWELNARYSVIENEKI